MINNLKSDKKLKKKLFDFIKLIKIVNQKSDNLILKILPILCSRKLNIKNF